MIRETRPRLTTVAKREAILDGHAISYIIKHSPRANYIRLEVRPQTGLTVIIPKSYRLTQLPNLLREKRRWILGKLAKYDQVQTLSAEQELKSGDSVPYLGRHLKVVKRHNPREANSVKLEPKRLVVSLKTENSRLNVILEWWYRQQAEKLLRQRVDELRSRLGVTYGRLCIRGARTRWGSCSQKGNLNLNWRLIMVPEPVIDYVIIHELAHLKEMNHTRRFWQLVAEHCPRWRQHKRWLKDHEAELAAKLPS